MPFVSSSGSVASLSKPVYRSPVQVSLSSTFSQDYLAIYRTQPAVRTVVQFLARNIAQIGLQLFKRNGDDDRERVTKHPAAQLLSKPNPWTTQYRWLEALAIDFFVYDTAYLLKGKALDGGGGQLIRLPPAMIIPKGDNWLTPDAFEFTGSRERKTFSADQVVYFRGYGGDTDIGMSPIESLRQILREEYSSSQMRDQIMRNGARVSGYLERPSTAPTWTTVAKTTFKGEWREQYGSNGTDAGGTPILEDDMKFVAASQTAKELQYVESRKLTREEVAAQYFVSPPMVGILDHATFSNITELHNMLYQDTLGPPLEMIQQEIGLQVLPDLDLSGKLYVEFNIRSKLSGNFETRQAAIQSAVGGPTMTINEARALDNRPAIEGGDELIRPLNVTQNGDQNPVPAEDAPPAGLLPNEKPPADPAAEEEVDQ